MEPYNVVDYLKRSAKYMHLNVLMDNGSIDNICEQNRLNIDDVRIPNVNRLIAQ